MTTVAGNGPLRLSKRDGKILFDQLRLPTQLTNYMTLPQIAKGDLKGAGLTNREWALYRPREPGHHRWVSPGLAVWGMGYGRSSGVAQGVMNLVCETAELDPA